MKQQWYSITDFDLFIQSTRILVYSMFGDKDCDIATMNLHMEDLNESEQKEINICLSFNETMSIAKNYVKLIKKNKTYAISESKYMKLIESLNARLVSNLLNKLANEGILESAFDEEINDFVFWAKDDPEPTTDN